MIISSEPCSCCCNLLPTAVVMCQFAQMKTVLGNQLIPERFKVLVTVTYALGYYPGQGGGGARIYCSGS
jgi:hypothetical protein